MRGERQSLGLNLHLWELILSLADSVRTELNWRMLSWCPRELLGVGKAHTHLVAAEQRCGSGVTVKEGHVSKDWVIFFPKTIRILIVYSTYTINS